MASSIFSADGTKRSIIGRAKAAAGTSGAPRRITGPSSHSNASRATMAAISPETDPVRLASEITSTLPIFFGNLLFYEAVGTFVFEEEDRVRVADGALYHGLGVGGERGRDHLEAWCIAEPGFDALGVIEGAARHDTVGSPDS